MSSLTEEIKKTFRQGSVLTRLIIANATVFAVVKLAGVIFFLMGTSEVLSEIVHWLAVPADILSLITRPWTPVTYMFLHEGLFHILFNMLWLYWFGSIFLEYLGSAKLFSTYILGGLAGAALYIIAFNVFPVFNMVLPYSFALGASAAVLAVVIAVSTYVPDYTIYLLFFGPVKIKYIAVVSVIVDILSIQSDNAGGHIAHIGGALFGFVYIRRLQKGKDLSRWFNRVTKSIISHFYVSQPVSKMKVVKHTDDEYNAKRAVKQQRLDEILDKISKSGYESLTKEEKDILFRISNDN